jgi:hypothetical protein
MDGENVRATEAARNPEQMRDVDDVTPVSPHDGPKVTIAAESIVAALEFNSVKIGRQRAAFFNLSRRPNQKIIAFAVQAPESPDYVPDVGANSEFRHATDVDGYFHEWNLNIEGAGEHREFMEYLSS